MGDNLLILILCIVVMTVNLAILLIVLFRRKNTQNELLQKELGLIRQQSLSSQSDIRKELNSQLSNLNQLTLSTVSRVSDSTISGLEQMRNTLDSRLSTMRNENRDTLSQIQQSVNDKLSESVGQGIDKSFKAVSIQLDNVSKSINEVNNLGTDIQGLKNILSNVKTRGIWGEVQLGTILEDMLAPSQYYAQFSIAGSSERVDYAVKLPSSEDRNIYLPIDSKFPLDNYEYLVSAEKQNNDMLIDTAKKSFISAITAQAKSIRNKYVLPPYTTDFAIMFVPSEGIYSLLVEENVLYNLQKDYSIMLAGPTTLAALISTFQLGFRNVAIQEKATEVITVLQQVKKSLQLFYTNIEAAQKNLATAGNNLEKASGNARRLETRLRKIEDIDEAEDYLDYIDTEN